MAPATRTRFLILLGLVLALGARAQPSPETLRKEEATTALISARVEIFSLLVDQRKKQEALAELDAITAVRNLEDNPDAQAMVLSAYLEGVEFLVAMGESRRAESLGKEGLARFDGSDLHQGYFQMSLANVYKQQGQAAKALEALRKATELFERARQD